MNIIELENLVVTSTGKKGHFKFMGKIKSVTGKSVKFSQWLEKVTLTKLKAVAIFL